MAKAQIKFIGILDAKWLKVMLLISFLTLLYSVYINTQFMSIATGLFLSMLMLWLVHFVDDKLLKNVDTQNEIVEKQNLAYAIYFASVALIIVGGFGFATIIFATLS